MQVLPQARMARDLSYRQYRVSPPGAYTLRVVEAALQARTFAFFVFTVHMAYVGVFACI